MMGWQQHQQEHMQIICSTFQTDNHASTSSLNYLRARCSSCRATNSVKVGMRFCARVELAVMRGINKAAQKL